MKLNEIFDAIRENNMNEEQAKAEFNNAVLELEKFEAETFEIAGLKAEKYLSSIKVASDGKINTSVKFRLIGEDKTTASTLVNLLWLVGTPESAEKLASAFRHAIENKPIKEKAVRLTKVAQLTAENDSLRAEIEAMKAQIAAMQKSAKKK